MGFQASIITANGVKIEDIANLLKTKDLYQKGDILAEVGEVRRHPYKENEECLIIEGERSTQRSVEAFYGMCDISYAEEEKRVIEGTVITPIETFSEDEWEEY